MSSPRIPLTVPAIRDLKGKRRITALTAYDAPTAEILDRAGVDILLVGDSVEMVVYGASDTLAATMDRMVAQPFDRSEMVAEVA